MPSSVLLFWVANNAISGWIPSELSNLIHLRILDFTQARRAPLGKLSV